MYEFLPTTLTVSGYAPVAAMMVWLRGEQVSVVTSGFHLTLPVLTAPGVTPIRVSPRFMRRCCGRCRKLAALTAVQDWRLGFRGYCDGCVNRLAKQCERENKRLPVVGEEFFCSACPRGQGLRPIAELCTPERDGRRRLRCKACRLNQLRTRRRLRRLALARNGRTTHNGRRQ